MERLKRAKGQVTPVALLAMLATLACHPDDASPLALRAALAKSSYRLHEPVVCSVELENRGQSVLIVWNRGLLPVRYYWFDIRDDRGEQVEYVGYSVKPYFDRSWLTALHPGDRIGHRVQLYSNDGPTHDQFGQFKLEKVGRYRLRVVYNGGYGNYREVWPGKAASEEIGFEIVP